MKNYLSQINEFIFKFHIKLKLNWEKFQFSIKFLFGVKQTWYIFILHNNKLHCKIKIYNTLLVGVINYRKISNKKVKNILLYFISIKFEFW